jgi:hypothetical protein
LATDGKEKTFTKKKLTVMESCELEQIKDFNFTDAENQAMDRFKQKTNEIQSVQFISELASTEGKETCQFGGF